MMTAPPAATDAGRDRRAEERDRASKLLKICQLLPPVVGKALDSSSFENVSADK